MELKFRLQVSSGCAVPASNRTIMELKYPDSFHTLQKYNSSNRTIMELKFATTHLQFQNRYPSNRTIMELK